MITLVRAAWQTEYRNPEFIGLSTDGYPTGVGVINGATIEYMDTGEKYEYDADNEAWYDVPSGGGGGSSNYNDLNNKPKVNGVTLSNDKTGQQLGLYNLIQAENNTTIGQYVVPQLTGEQVTQAYNDLVAGKSVVIADANGMMHFSVIEADDVSDEVCIVINYFEVMYLTYKDDGTITNKNIQEEFSDSNKLPISFVSGYTTKQMVVEYDDDTPTETFNVVVIS